MCQSRWIIPEWDEVIQPWVRGLGGIQKASDSLKGPYITIHRREGINIDD